MQEHNSFTASSPFSDTELTQRKLKQRNVYAKIKTFVISITKGGLVRSPFLCLQVGSLCLDMLDSLFTHRITMKWPATSMDWSTLYYRGYRDNSALSEHCISKTECIKTLTWSVLRSNQLSRGGTFLIKCSVTLDIHAIRIVTPLYEWDSPHFGYSQWFWIWSPIANM